MDIFRLILRNTRYHARSWGYTLAGLVIGTMVITGALITGDSVKYSLHRIVGQRLGSAQYAMTPGDRLFRDQLGNDLSAATGLNTVTLLSRRGVVTAPDHDRSIPGAEIHGIGKDFASLWDADDFPFPSGDEAVISANLAARLQAAPGDAIVIRIAEEGFAPANAPFVSDRPAHVTFRLKIRAILSDRQGGRYSLASNQAAPFNVFIDRALLAKKLKTEGFSNTMLVSGDPPGGREELNQALRRCLTPADAGLKLEILPGGVCQISSRRIFIEDTIASLIRQSFPDAKGLLTYMVNQVMLKGRSTPYSFVTAADAGTMPSNPAPGEIVINRWLSDDLAAVIGDSITLRYFTMKSNRTLQETEGRWRVAAIIPTPADTSWRALMPDFPGISSSGSCRDWETGTPVNLDLIRDKDEAYWNQYRGTPKALISMDDGNLRWKNPFGSHTAFRFSVPPGEEALNSMIRKIDPKAIGMDFIPVHLNGMEAATNSTDFGELFLGLGGLVIISGMILSALMFSLFLKRRTHETTLMRALGFSGNRILAILAIETIPMALAGSAIGSLASVGYTKLIVIALNTLWVEAVNTSSLILHVSTSSLFSGFLSGFFLNLLLLMAILWKNRNIHLPGKYEIPVVDTIRRNRLATPLLLTCSLLLLIAGAALMIRETLAGRFYASMWFMTAGILILAGMMVLVRWFLLYLLHHPLHAHSGWVSHGLRNLALQRNRSFSTILLLALGSFTVMVTGLNRKSVDQDAGNVRSGTGGFGLWIETTMPVPADISTLEGLKKLGLDDEPSLAGTTFVPLPGTSGDDASCLNLNQVNAPGLLGIPTRRFTERNPFTFLNLAAEIRSKASANPWGLLSQPPNTGVLYGFADQSVLTWGLRKKVGDTLIYRDEQGDTLRIILAGGLENSVFQGHILVDDSLLRSHFPSTTRIRKLLADLPDSNRNEVIQVLEKQLRDQGAVVQTSTEKLAAFGAVENTYLDIFVLLGGLGLLIGTAAFTVMLLRNLDDRREELRLYRSLGFPPGLIVKILVLQHGFIFCIGVISGAVAALCSTLP